MFTILWKKKSKNFEKNLKILKITQKFFFHKIVNIHYLGTPFGPKVDWDYLNTFLAQKLIFDFLGKISQAGKPHSETAFLATFFKLHVSNVRAHDFMGVRKVAEPRKNDQA